MDNQELAIDGPLSNLLQAPWELDGGEAESAVLMVPADTGAKMFRSQTAPELLPVPILTAKTNNVTLFRERRHAPLPGVILSIAHGQSELRSVAANLFTRIDVEWSTPSSEAPAADYNKAVADAGANVPQTVPLGSLPPL